MLPSLRAPFLSEVEPPAKQGFRSDVEGLRAVAILLVASFHIWFGRVSGGVDVFLMISGFFVVGGLLRRHRADAAPALGPYFARLARRLIPSLVVVLAVVVVAAALLNPLNRWADLASQTLASLLYSQNWLLSALGADYAAADTSLSPLQHIWSLSIQGQLFVAVPIVFAVVAWIARRRLDPARGYRLLTVLVVTATAASFAYACWLVTVDQPRAYYDTGARLWEYLAGALLALVLPKLRIPPALRAAAGWLGLALILGTGVLLDAGELFPGPAALMPIGGAALVIAAGSDGGSRFGVDRVLGHPRISAAGGLAYGVYLWHWPLLIFFIQLTDPDVGVLVGGAVLALSVLLALLTNRLTASIGRLPSLPSLKAGAVRVVAVAAAVAVLVPAGWLAYREVRLAQVDAGLLAADYETHPGALVTYAPGAWTAPPDADVIPDPIAAATDWARAIDDGCSSGWGDVTLTVCSAGDLDAERSIALVGGSHSDHWLPPLELLAEEHGFRVDVMLKSGCPLSATHEERECDVWQRKVIDAIDRGGYDFVFTTATRPEEATGNDVVPDGYVTIWQQLERSGHQVIAVRDTPWFSESRVDCVAAPEIPNAECSIPVGAVMAEQSPIEVTEIPANVSTIDLTSYICPDGSCPAVLGNRLVYRDANHLTATFTVTLAPALGDQLAGVTGWW